MSDKLSPGKKKQGPGLTLEMPPRSDSYPNLGQTDSRPSTPTTPSLLEVPGHSEGGIKMRTGRRGSLSPSLRSGDDIVKPSEPRKRVSSTFESFDYNVIESQRFLQEKDQLTPKTLQQASLTRWFVNGLIGVYVAVLAVIVALLIHNVSALKMRAVYALIKDCRDVSCLILPTFVWMAINMTLVFIGSYLVTYHAPHAAGSGIPQIKCYLNGIKLPGLLSLRTLIAKAGGVVLSVGGGLACGKEGPMIHSGAICASGMSRGEFGCGSKKWKPSCCRELRTDEERRDFVAAGAASGVSAAFASPVGGVLFSLEEGASFLKQMLTWRMLFSSAIASMCLNIMMSALKGHPEDMSSPGLISLGYVGDISYKTYDILIFIVMALFGGISGAAFVQLNYKITLFRRTYVTKKWLKVAEAVLVAAVSAIVLVLLIYSVPNCAPIKGFHPINQTAHHNSTMSPVHHDVNHGDDHGDRHRRAVVGDDVDEEAGHHEPEGDHGGDHGGDPYGNHGHGYVFQGFCPYGEHNRMADILFKTPEGGLHAMLHGAHDEWEFLPLIVLFVVYHILATWTYGLMVSSGVFIPSLLIGAIWGRIIGMILIQFIPGMGTEIVKYVLIGAACQLGGTVRMTISLTVIVIECTGDITFGIPIMISLIVAKWVGDFFNPGIYDLHIEIMGIPLLSWDPPEMCYAVKASDAMSIPVTTLRTVEKIGRIIKVLNSNESHNGFPVVDDFYPDQPDKNPENTYGRLKGFIMRSQLNALLMNNNGELNEEEIDSVIDLRMHMDGSPYTINEDISLPKIFKLFRGLGLRHLVVTNDNNRVVGMITRINLAKFREESVRGGVHLEELYVEGLRPQADPSSFT